MKHAGNFYLLDAHPRHYQVPVPRRFAEIFRTLTTPNGVYRVYVRNEGTNYQR